MAALVADNQRSLRIRSRRTCPSSFGIRCGIRCESSRLHSALGFSNFNLASPKETPSLCQTVAVNRSSRGSSSSGKPSVPVCKLMDVERHDSTFLRLEWLSHVYLDSRQCDVFRPHPSSNHLQLNGNCRIYWPPAIAGGRQKSCNFSFHGSCRDSGLLLTYPSVCKRVENWPRGNCRWLRVLPVQCFLSTPIASKHLVVHRAYGRQSEGSISRELGIDWNSSKAPLSKFSLVHRPITKTSFSA